MNIPDTYLLLIDFETVDTRSRNPLEFHADLLHVAPSARSRRGIPVERLASCGGFIQHSDTGWRESEFHKRSGLVDAYDAPGVPQYTYSGVEAKLVRMLEAAPKQPLLCARNVAFERSILEFVAPEALQRLHPYRNVDMSAFNLLPRAYALYKSDVFGSHRAKGDCKRELAILREVLS